MVTAGEGPSAPPSSSYGGNGGVGGKFRKRPFGKTHKTPYDRPPTALRNPSWLSKLVVEPASKLIASGAQRFFSSVFRKRLPPPPPPPPELNQVLHDEQPDAVKKAEAQEAALSDGGNLIHHPSSGISDLEQLLRKKTFTRSEIDQLTELLHSRAVDTPHRSDVRRAEANNGELVAISERQQEYLASPPELKKTLCDTSSHGLILTPGTSARVLEEDIASPAEIAKAYMGNQASKVSPSMLGLRTRAVRRDATLLSNVPFTPKSPMTSLPTKADSHVEVLENGFATPRPRGRSAIYSMARTPYSRVHPSAFDKSSGPRMYGFGGPLPSSSVKELPGEFGSNRVGLKRRSSALEEDLGSVGPMRRTRQKASMLSHKTFLPRELGGVSSASGHPLAEERVYENGDIRTSRKSYVHVPPSSKMALKIFEHLENVSPGKKSSELKLIAAKEKSPAKLTTDMLRGQALKSLEDAESPKLLQTNHVGNKLEGSSGSKQVSSYVSTTQEKDTTVVNVMTQEKTRTETNVLQKFVSQSSAAGIAGNSGVTEPVKGIFTSAEASDSGSKLVTQRPQKKRGFMMSAHEDFLDLDDETNFNGSDSKGNANSGSSEDHNSASAIKMLPNKLTVSNETRTPGGPISGKRSNLEGEDTVSVVPGQAGASPFSLASDATPLPVATIPSSLEFGNPKVASDKVLGPEKSLLLSVAEPSDSKLWSLKHPKSDTLSSDGISTSVADASFRIPVTAKGIDGNVPETGIENGGLDTSPSVSLSSTSGGISSIFPTSNSNYENNGPSAGSPTFSFVSTPASTSLANSFVTNGTSNFATSTATSFSTASSSAPVSSTEAPVFPKMPIFGSGSSGKPSVSAFNTEPSATGNSSNLPSSVATIGTGSGSFGLISKSTFSTAVTQSQDSSTATGNGSVHNAVSSAAGSGAESVTAAMPVQFGSSASSPVFGTSGVVTFTSSNTLFSSSTTAANPFTPTDLAPSSSSASLSETKSSGPVVSATSSMFSFQASAPSSSSSITNAFSSNSSPTSLFSFSGSSSATASVTNALSSSSAAAPVFNFGGNSSGTNAVSSSSGSTGLFGVSPLSSSTENNPASSSNTTTSVFGASWQPSKSFSSTFNSSPSTGFSFEGSSTFAGTNTAPMAFNSSSPIFSFTSASASTSSSQPLFGGAPPAFGSSAPSFTAAAANNDQMNTEDSMAEDPVHSSISAAPAFGQQQPVSPSPGGFVFGSQAAPSQANPFQFGGQQHQPASQNTSLFQASGSQEFGSAGGSFSLGSGGGMGGDKSGRKFIKVNRNRNRRK